MRADKDLMIFIGKLDWYTFQKNKGYIPTDKAPEEAIQAMKRVNIRLKNEYEINR